MAELLMVERATTAEQGLDATKVQLAETEAVEVRLVETKVALQKSLEALESEQKA